MREGEQYYTPTPQGRIEAGNSMKAISPVLPGVAPAETEAGALLSPKR